jgi:hypothetical protein
MNTEGVPHNCQESEELFLISAVTPHPTSLTKSTQNQASCLPQFLLSQLNGMLCQISEENPGNFLD